MANGISLNAHNYNSIVSGSMGKLYVPVKPSDTIYAQFDHISGFAAKSNQNGVSVSKIQILNTLINQLISMKANQNLSPIDPSMSSEEMDSLIKNYQGQIQTTMQMAEATGYGLAGAAPQTGAIFSLEV